MKWIKLPSGKWKPVTKNPKEFCYEMTYAFKKEREARRALVWSYCEKCKKKYNLKDPCIHHLSDSPEHQKIYAEYKKQLKNKPTQTKETFETKGLYD
tara:strand:- start:8190 stop:8480 length:291 start_codon:yes stop_codon:yes gene_type:complete